MAFKLKSGNKSPLEFKLMGSSPVKAEAGLADPEYHHNPDVPSDVIIGESTAYDPANPTDTKKEKEEATKKFDAENKHNLLGTEVDDGETGTKNMLPKGLPKGTGGAYDDRRMRRAKKQYQKEAYKKENIAAGGKARLTREQRLNLSQNKQKMKLAEAESKGTTSYNLKWSLGEGVQEGLEPKASRLQRKVGRIESKRGVDSDDNTEYRQSELSKMKEAGKKLRKERKGK